MTVYRAALLSSGASAALALLASATNFCGLHETDAAMLACERQAAPLPYANGVLILLLLGLTVWLWRKQNLWVFGALAALGVAPWVLAYFWG